MNADRTPVTPPPVPRARTRARARRHPARFSRLVAAAVAVASTVALTYALARNDRSAPAGSLTPGAIVSAPATGTAAASVGDAGSMP